MVERRELEDELSEIIETKKGVTYRLLKFPKSTFDVVIAEREAFYASTEKNATQPSAESINSASEGGQPVE